MRYRSERREVIKMLGGALLAYASAPPLCAAELAGLDEDEFFDLVEAELEPGFQTLGPRRKLPRWSDIPVKDRPVIVWEDGSFSIDYRHLGAERSEEEFVVDGASLRTICNLNSFILDDEDSLVLIGLRGCQVAGQPSGFAKSHSVVEVIPDHVSFRCLIGVWRRGRDNSGQGDELALFRASTVPNADLMNLYAHEGIPCNMLPTGLHRYEVGLHGRGRDGKGTRFRQPGAFLQRSASAVLRTPLVSNPDIKKLVYRTGDRWDSTAGVVADNIHAAILDDRGVVPEYSSAGCQTIPGDYDKDRRIPTGTWAAFRAAAGLQEKPDFSDDTGLQTTDDGKRFAYLLLTGRDIRLINSAQNPGPTMRRLRVGSHGAHVGKLRERLGLTTSVQASRFDLTVMAAYIGWQKDQTGTADGIVTPVEAETLGFAL